MRKYKRFLVINYDQVEASFSKIEDASKHIRDGYVDESTEEYDLEDIVVIDTLHQREYHVGTIVKVTDIQLREQD